MNRNAYGQREVVITYGAGVLAGAFVLAFAEGDPILWAAGGVLIGLHVVLLAWMGIHPWAHAGDGHVRLQRNLSAPISLVCSLVVSVRLLPDYVYIIALFWTLAGAMFNFFVFRSPALSYFLGAYLLGASVIGAWVGQHPPFLLGSLAFLSATTVLMLNHQRLVLAHLETTIETKEKEVERVTYFDPTTGLPNRLAVRERLAKAGPQDRLAIIAVDIEGAAALRQQFGEQGYGLLLRYVGARLRGGPDEFIGYGGGDRFLLVVPDDDDTRGRVLARLDAATGDYRIAGDTARVSATAGICRFPLQGTEPERVIAQAEETLTFAKDGPTGRVRTYDHARSTSLRESYAIQNDLQRAALSEFVLHYQPKFDREGAVCGCEALLRWQHPARGLLEPAAFIEVLERMDRVAEIGEWTVFTSLRDMRRLRSILDIPVAVNLAPRQLQDPKLLDRISSLIADTGGAQLELELTEGTLMRDATTAIGTLQAMRAKGVKVSIDDFGTGYSSLARLIALPVDTIKIDRSFVNQIHRGPDVVADAAAVVRLLVTMSRQMGKLTVAEGVETPEQHRYLRDVGCEVFQGYLFARPMPLAEFTAFLRARVPQSPA